MINNVKIGFIGCGNMAQAILGGIYKSKIINNKNIFVSNRTKEKLDKIQKKYGYNVSIKNDEVIKKASDILFICVKPQVFDVIAPTLKKSISKKQIVVSIMAGKSISYIEKALGTKNIVRVMPNTPALVGAGISVIATNLDSKNDKLNLIIDMFKSVGDIYQVDERHINAITQVSGASPAWIFMFIEALADGGVKCGLPRHLAYILAKAAVVGSGKLATESDEHVAALKDMVCSPAGTTIEGVKVLEEKGFRGAIIDAVCAAYEKTTKL